MRRFKTLIPGVVLLCVTGAVRAAEDYKIVLNRPHAVGDKIKVDMTVKFKSTQKAGDQTQKQEFTAEVEGVCTIEAVTDADKGSQPVKYSCKVDKCTRDGDAIVPPGTVVTAENVDGKTKVTVDGKDADDEDKAVLAQLFDTNDPKDPGGDKIAGTTDRQAVGGTWKTDGDFVAKKLAGEQLPFKDGDIEGTGKLVSVDSVDDKPVATVEIEFKGGFDHRETPDGAVFKDAKVAFKTTSHLSTDGQGHDSVETVKMSLHFTVAGPKGDTEVTVDREQTVTVKSVK